jgi:hypothetical protein
VRLYLEKTHHKKGLVEWLKVKDLSSIPTTVKKKKRKERYIVGKYVNITMYPPVQLLYANKKVKIVIAQELCSICTNSFSFQPIIKSGPLTQL